MRPADLYASPNALAPSYSRFRVAERLLLTGHSHQAWPDRALAGQVKLREIFRKARTDGAKDPIQVAAAFDACPLVGKIPDVTSPGLQFDKFQGCILHHLDFHDSRVHRVGGHIVWRG